MHLTVKRRRGRAAVRILYYSYDIVALTGAGYLAMVIETNLGTRNEGGFWSINYLLLFVIFEVAALQAMRIYRRVWSRSSIREFFIVAIGLTVGALISSCIWSISKADVTWSDFRCGFIAAQLAIWFILIPRAFPEMVRELAVDSKHRNLGSGMGDGRKQILVYGAGTMGNLFVEYVKNCAPEEFQKFQISGFLDRNRKLRKRTLQGYKIHGELDQLEKLTKRYPLHGILVAISDIPDEGMHEVFTAASKSGLKVYRWQADRMPREIEFGEAS